VGTTIVTWTATDASGNQASAKQTVRITDTTPPVVTPPPDAFAFATGQLTAVALGTATAHDLVDGALTPTPSTTGPFAPGTHTVTWRATDAHGNTGTATQKVVVRYDFRGFRPPISGAQAWNEGNAGRTVPVKWQIRNPQGGYIGDLAAVSALRVRKVSCGTGVPLSGGASDAASPGKSALRYDTGGGQYLFNWKTGRELAGECAAFILGLNDGTEHSAKFRLK
jgi:hypothetical protein